MVVLLGFSFLSSILQQRARAMCKRAIELFTDQCHLQLQEPSLSRARKESIGARSECNASHATEAVSNGDWEDLRLWRMQKMHGVGEHQ